MNIEKMACGGFVTASKDNLVCELTNENLSIFYPPIEPKEPNGIGDGRCCLQFTVENDGRMTVENVNWNENAKRSSALDEMMRISQEIGEWQK